MRPARTSLEEAAISRLVAALRSVGRSVSEDAEIKDKPDALIFIDGIRVAVECRSLSRESLLRLHGVKLVDDELLNYLLPVEPHVWLKQAVEAKNPKATEYRVRSSAQFVILLLHSSSLLDNLLYENSSELYKSLLLSGLWETNSFFDAVLFTDSASGDVVLLSDRGTPLALPRHRSLTARIDSLPIHQAWFATVVATAGPDGTGQITTQPLTVGGPNAKPLQPLDKRFFFDYPAYVKSVVAAQAKGLKSPSPAALPVQGSDVRLVNWPLNVQGPMIEMGFNTRR